MNESACRAASALQSELRIAGLPTLLQSAEVEAPVVIGWRRPVLILPPDIERLSPDGLRSLLAHELAHVTRRDYLANLVQSVIEVLLFFSPAVRWMSRRIREAREFCCDDIAIARCGDPRNYIEALTTLAALGAVNTVRAALGAAGPRLITRVRRLLQEDAMPRFSRARLVALAVVLIGLAGSGAWLSVATAARIPRTSASAGNAYQDTLPYGFVHEQEGSGVDLHKVVSSAQTPGQSATIRNISNETIVGLRFVAAVEGLTWPRPRVRLLVSDAIPVSVAPGQSVEVAPHFPTVAQLQEIAAGWGGSRLQLFFGVQSVRFANGSEWSMTPNPFARSGSGALAVARVRRPAIPRLAYSRDLIVRDADRPQVPFGACRDEQNRATSHGGTVPMLNEPGRRVKCENGRWVESTGRWPRW